MGFRYRQLLQLRIDDRETPLAERVRSTQIVRRSLVLGRAVPIVVAFLYVMWWTLHNPTTPLSILIVAIVLVPLLWQLGKAIAKDRTS